MMIQQGAARFYKSVLHLPDFGGIVDNDLEGVKIAEMFLKKGNEKKRIMLMKSHGITSIGPDIP